MNHNWEDDFDFSDYDDYKTAWCEHERLRQEKSINGWIYIGIDTRHKDMAKIGLTTGQLGTRASGSQNPFYSLLCAFKIKEGVAAKRVSEIEASTIQFLSQRYERINHTTTNRPSEWFYANPDEIRMVVHDFLYEHYSWEMHSYYCTVREVGVIYSWKNNKLLFGESRNPYQANDLSSPPVDSACYMPGGCGSDCDCWD